MRFALLVIAASIALSHAAWAAPRGVTRVVRTFDFEERRLGNAEDTPMNWVKVEGQGLPHYVSGKLSNDRARSGQFSFRFDLNGGGLIYQYPAGQIRVQTGAHYHVEAYVQTTVLPNARARLTAFMTDVDGHPIPRTVRHSILYAAGSSDEPWKRLEVGLAANDPAQAFLVIQLELLQPAQYAATTLGDHALFAQDIRGSAWFDDVSIAEVPQVELSTDRPGNIFRRHDPLLVHVRISDPFTHDLSAQLEVVDAADRPVFQSTGALDGAADDASPGTRAMVLALPQLRPGWYRVSLGLSSQGKSLGAQSLDLISLPDDGIRTSPDSRFGIVATDLPFEGWDELPSILPLLAAGRVKLAIWSATGDIQEWDGVAFDRLLERFAELGIAPTACLLDLPPAVSNKFGNGSWPLLLTHDASQWRPQLAEMISRHANHLDRWQLGADGSDAFVTDPRMREVYAAVYKEFAALMRDPDLAMPWPAWYELPAELPATVALSIPPSVLPSQMPLYMQDIRGHEGHNLSLTLQLLDRERYGRLAQIKDLAQRVVYALSAGATRIDFPLPFHVSREEGHLVKQPDEMLLIERTLTTTLSGATYEGKVPIADGVEAFLFERRGQSILALWSKDNVSGIKSLALNLGERPMRVDLWGNVTPLLRGRGKKAGQVQLTVGPTPTFLIDIDGPQAQLRASLGFDQPLVESSFEPHTRRLHFTNPYKTLMSGTLKIKAPPGWTINPPTMVFSVNPGEKFDRDVQITFPYNSFAGVKTLDCEFTTQDAGGAPFNVPVTLTLGLSDVGMQSLALRDGNDVIVQQMISNYGTSPINYNAFAILPGQPRQERLATNVGSGSTVIKRYRFKDIPPGQEVKVRIGLKELRGVRVLNDEVTVP